MVTQSQLSAPFEPSKVSWRVGSTNKKKFDAGQTTDGKRKGMPLAYIDARDVMNRLDEVCGIDGWSDRYEDFKGRLICVLSIKIDGEWVSKSDGADDSDVEGAKGGISDAFKRAAVKWGIGRYLYDVASVWVELDAYWCITKDSQTVLASALNKASNMQPKINEPLISFTQCKELDQLIVAAGGTVDKFTVKQSIKNLSELTVEQFNKHKINLTKAIGSI
jgi:hypothetical protein